MAARDYIASLEGIIIGRNCMNTVTNMYNHVQNVSKLLLKEPQYINLHLPIPQFPMSFISMDLLGPHHGTKKETSMH